ncbi:helix-turn-helix domain-containing protein [Rhodococcus sp. NPDC057529]
MHRTSLYYRINKIRDILGVDPRTRPYPVRQSATCLDAIPDRAD